VKTDSSLRLDAARNGVERPMVQIMVEQRIPSVSLDIEGDLSSLIRDTRSRVSILQPGASRNEVMTTVLRPYGVTGKVFDMKDDNSFLSC